VTDASAARAFRVAYDGREYAGFQRQPHATTVEGTLLRALAKHGILDRGDGPTHATPPGYAAAGRTDAGVSAVAQTVAFEAPDWLTPRAFNGHLPGSVRVWAAADVPAGFHATHDAVRRTYRYHLYAPARVEETDHDHAVDDGRVRDALARLSGEQDFHNLTTSDETGTVRDLTTTTARGGDILVVEVSAGVPAGARAPARRRGPRGRSRHGRPSLIDRLLASEPISRSLGSVPHRPNRWCSGTCRTRASRSRSTPRRPRARGSPSENGTATPDAAAAATGAIRDRIAGTDQS